MNTIRHHRVAAGLAGLVMAAAVAVPTTAIAASSTPELAMPAASDLGPRLERACLRLPNLESRTANLIERLEGDATVRGSLAWLQAQIDKANARGRTDLAEVLTNRLAVRQQTLVVLQQRQSELLPRLAAFCAEHGAAV
jgi:hypothetical protein